MSAFIDSIMQRATQQPNAIALKSDAHIIHYAELAARVHTTAEELASMQLQRIGICSENSIDWVILDLAAGQLGITVVPLPLHFSQQQQDHAVKTSGIDGLFTDRTQPDDSMPYKPLTSLKTLTWLQTASTAYRYSYPGSHPQTHPAKITFTSGSTANAKGVCLDMHTLSAVVKSLADILHCAGVKSHLSLLPLSTLLENIAGIYAQLVLGNCITLSGTTKSCLRSNHYFDATCFLALLDKHTVDSVILMPQMLKNIVEHANAANAKPMKFMAVGGGKIDSQLIRKAQQLGLAVYEGYGLSECASVVSLNTPSANRLGSVGKPLPHVQLEVADDGEILVSGNAMTGYLPDTSDDKLNDRHEVNVSDNKAPESIYTGDLGYVDNDGYLYVTGRKKNAIISSFGRNISPEWVESVFVCSVAIQQIAVFGEAQPYLSAVIVAADNSAYAHLSETIRAINKTLPDYARIVNWVRAPQSFSHGNGQLTENGKLRRAVIYQCYRQALASPPLKYPPSEQRTLTHGQPSNAARAR